LILKRRAMDDSPTDVHESMEMLGETKKIN